MTCVHGVVIRIINLADRAVWTGGIKVFQPITLLQTPPPTRPPLKARSSRRQTGVVPKASMSIAVVCRS